MDELRFPNHVANGESSNSNSTILGHILMWTGIFVVNAPSLIVTMADDDAKEEEECCCVVFWKQRCYWWQRCWSAYWPLLLAMAGPLVVWTALSSFAISTEDTTCMTAATIIDFSRSNIILKNDDAHHTISFAGNLPHLSLFMERRRQLLSSSSSPTVLLRNDWDDKRAIILHEEMDRNRNRLIDVAESSSRKEERQRQQQSASIRTHDDFHGGGETMAAAGPNRSRDYYYKDDDDSPTLISIDHESTEHATLSLVHRRDEWAAITTRMSFENIFDNLPSSSSANAYCIMENDGNNVETEEDGSDATIAAEPSSASLDLDDENSIDPNGRVGTASSEVHLEHIAGDVIAEEYVIVEPTLVQHNDDDSAIYKPIICDTSAFVPFAGAINSASSEPEQSSTILADKRSIVVASEHAAEDLRLDSINMIPPPEPPDILLDDSSAAHAIEADNGPLKHSALSDASKVRIGNHDSSTDSEYTSTRRFDYDDREVASAAPSRHEQSLKVFSSVAPVMNDPACVSVPDKPNGYTMGASHTTKESRFQQHTTVSEPFESLAARANKAYAITTSSERVAHHGDQRKEQAMSQVRLHRETKDEYGADGSEDKAIDMPNTPGTGTKVGSSCDDLGARGGMDDGESTSSVVASLQKCISPLTGTNDVDGSVYENDGEESFISIAFVHDLNAKYKYRVPLTTLVSEKRVDILRHVVWERPSLLVSALEKIVSDPQVKKNGNKIDASAFSWGVDKDLRGTIGSDRYKRHVPLSNPTIAESIAVDESSYISSNSNRCSSSSNDSSSSSQRRDFGTNKWERLQQALGHTSAYLNRIKRSLRRVDRLYFDLWAMDSDDLYYST